MAQGRNIQFFFKLVTGSISGRRRGELQQLSGQQPEGGSESGIQTYVAAPLTEQQAGNFCTNFLALAGSKQLYREAVEVLATGSSPGGLSSLGSGSVGSFGGLAAGLAASGSGGGRRGGRRGARVCVWGRPGRLGLG